MNQAATIQLKSAISPVKRGGAGKFLVGLLMMFVIVAAGYFCWRHFKPSKHVQATAARRTTSVAAKTAAANVSSPKSESHPAVATSDRLTTIKTAAVGLADSLIATVLPDAKAETVPQETPPAPKTETPLPAKRIPLQPVAATAAAVAAPLSVRKPQVLAPLTPEQKRLQVAQQGFDHVMDRAVQHPTAYGFPPDAELGDAVLGKEIPVYTIGLQGKDKFADQPVSSLLKQSNEWLYPIVLRGHIYYMVQVKYDGHDYVLGDGSSALGTTYDKITARWPASEGFHPQLITVRGLPAYYFTIPELPDQNITDTSRMFDYNPELSPASIVLANVP